MKIDQTVRERTKYFNSFCSKTVSEFLARDQTLSIDDKSEIMKIAKRNVDAMGKFRVHWVDFQWALKEWRRKNR